jgi:hypothetical protein
MPKPQEIDRKAFGRRLTQLVRQLYRSKHHFITTFDLPRGTVSPWFSGKSLPSLDWVAFLAQTLGVTADYLLFGNDLMDGLADRFYGYIRARLRGEGVPMWVLDQALSPPAEMMELEVEVFLRDLQDWEWARQSAVRARLREEESDQLERPAVPRVVALTVERLREFSRESLEFGGNPDKWVVSKPQASLPKDRFVKKPRLPKRVSTGR